MQLSPLRRGDSGIAPLQGALPVRSSPLRLTTASLVAGPITSVDRLLPLAEGSDEPDNLLVSGGEPHIGEYGGRGIVTMGLGLFHWELPVTVPEVEGPERH